MTFFYWLAITASQVNGVVFKPWAITVEQNHADTSLICWLRLFPGGMKIKSSQPEFLSLICRIKSQTVRIRKSVQVHKQFLSPSYLHFLQDILQTPNLESIEALSSFHETKRKVQLINYTTTCHNLLRQGWSSWRFRRLCKLPFYVFLNKRKVVKT